MCTWNLKFLLESPKQDLSWSHIILAYDPSHFFSIVLNFGVKTNKFLDGSYTFANFSLNKIFTAAGEKQESL